MEDGPVFECGKSTYRLPVRAAGAACKREGAGGVNR